MAALGLGAVLVLPVSKSVADEGGRLSTHVLDTLSGKPAGGMKIDFYVSENGAFRLVMQMTTNADGRTDKPVLVGDALKAGSYQFVFHVGEYFKAKGVPQADPPFLDMVPVQFSIADAKAHYHVPLLTTPWSYSTYRGS
ncbi:hydroxyisourate hydrolase [Methylobacterium sp. 77]|uniref:hydroxyisourate hydrolase n=1 Tax=Methylobacterium sp. 77 TaxID=1101192 RepID=UPI0003754DE6|nr:hydroxyisourate hydrolase [Methylobacterium sp. 77]